MASTRAAVRYAQAILDIAVDKGVSLEVGKDMHSIAGTIGGNAELHIFIESPTIKADIKEKALLEVFANVNAVTKSLFHLLFVNKRFSLLKAIAHDYNMLLDVKNGIEVARVTTAIPMTAELEAKVMAKVATFSSKLITIVNIVDESIIGGFILRIGDKQYNASIANRLHVLKRELSN